MFPRFFLLAFSIFIAPSHCVGAETLLPDEWGGGWEPDPALVKSTSERRPDFNYRESLVSSYSLPDLLTNVAGDNVDNKDDWETGRRQEVVGMLADHVYGRVPGLPERQSMHLVSVDHQALDGRATSKVVHIHLGVANRELRIELKLFLPNRAEGPVPLFLLINHRSPENLDMTRAVRNGFWPAEEVIERGYGIAGFQAADLDPDQHDGFVNGVHGLFGESIESNTWGALAAWGWGASRAMDYFEADSEIDQKRIAALGHSRGGKASLWTGARDTRFALVISNNSGCGGAALSQRRFGETVGRINRSFPHWFCSNFERYNDREPLLPFDQHFLIAAIAPRAVYVASASRDLWADPVGEYQSLYHAGRVYELYGDAGFSVPTPPAAGHPVRSGRMAYHIRKGGHGLETYDWHRYMDFADSLWR